MNRCLLIVALALMQPGCNFFVNTATKEAKPLSYVGEIAFGDATTQDGHVVVPVMCFGGDWHKNSGIVPTSVDADVVDDTIELTILTSVSTGNAGGRYMVLPPGTQGEYTIYYRDPDGTRHAIGVVEIP